VRRTDELPGAVFRQSEVFGFQVATAIEAARRG
jgi:hypothetical protein